ncbi:MAG: hypothetical protein H6706_00305 [Myxococcales bacterium]|nr:hypothetical protein [Myxococcales bacterium]
MARILVLCALAGGLLATGPAHAQLDQIELALKLRSYYGKGKFIYNSPKYLTNYNDCRARGETDAFCKTLAGICAAQEQPFFGGPYAGLFRGLGLNQVFKLDCGSQECFQCCHVPGQGCHTSFVGFPVINCNPRYGEGTNAAGLTLIVDPDAHPGEACLTIPQTCEHIPRCAGDPNELQALRDDLDNGGQHPVNAPGAAENRARYFASQMFTKWCGSLDAFHTGPDRDPELPGFERVVDVQNFLTGRGCEGWRDHVAAVFPFDWEAENFAVRAEDGTIQPASSQLNALCQWGMFRALESVPNLGDRLTFVDSTIWPDMLRAAYLAQVGDADAALLHHASPIVLDLLRCNPGVDDYRLLAVPLAGEVAEDRVFNGCDLGLAPRIFLDAEAAGPARVRVRVELRDPEVGGEHEHPIPLTIFWGDGRVSLEEVPAGQAEASFEHGYAQGGRYVVIALAENTSGLRGFAAVVAETGGADAGEAEGPVVVSEVRLVDAVVRANTLTGNARTLFIDVEGHDADTDAVHRVGLTRGQPIEFNADIALGTVVAHNTGAAHLDRLILRPHWREGFYTGLRKVFLRAARAELHVFSTATGDTVAVELPLTPETVRVYAAGEAEPLPAELLTVDENGQLEILLHDRDRLTERVEIDLPQALLAAQAPGPLAADHPALGQTSWIEDRPEQFIAVGRDPDAGPPMPDMGVAGDGGRPDAGAPGSDAGGPDGARPGADGGEADAAPTGGSGGGGGDCSTAPGGPGGWLWALGLLPLLRRRRRPGRTTI